MPYPGFNAQGSTVFFFLFSILFVRLSPPEPNHSSKHGFLSSIDDIVLAVFEKIILFFN
jgi:hypothetical protein